MLDIKDQRQPRFAFPENPKEPGLEIEDEIDEMSEESSAEDAAWAIVDTSTGGTTVARSSVLTDCMWPTWGRLSPLQIDTERA